MKGFVVLQLTALVWLAGCAQQATDDKDSAEAGAGVAASQSASASDPQSAAATAMKEGDATAVATAIDEIKKTGTKTELVSLLVRGLGNQHADVRETCSQELVDMAPDSHEAVVALMEEGLQDEDPVVRRHSAEALGQIGPPAVDSIPALNQLQLNETEQDDVRKAASLALEQINEVPESPADLK